MSTGPALATRDYATERPAPDAVFEAYRRQFDFDPVPRRERVVERDTFPEWTRERVAYRVPYANEEMIADIFIPRGRTPPCQTAVFFPGSNAIQSEPLARGRPLPGLESFVRSGRALVFPMYKGTFERSDSLTARTDRATRFYRDRMVQWAKEVRSTVDLLHTRPDIDTTRLIYFGWSMGGRVAPMNLTVEPRFRTAILICPGMASTRHPPRSTRSTTCRESRFPC